MIRLGRWQDVLADVDTVDAVICDPPYGAKTHDTHTATATSSRATGLYKGVPVGSKATRRALNYTAWTAGDVVEFVSSWAPRCRGWMVAMTSHDLCEAYTDAMEAAGRYVFAPLPFFSPGSRIRLSGDGPSSWTCWIVVSRPRSMPYAKWGTLPGGYAGPSPSCEVVGGKPMWLMQALVRDYTRPGDLVCDPFVGSGTTAVAALSEGRRFIGAEAMPEHHAIATRRLAGGFTPSMF
jgi:site-specific DNA-methyltransferase (adenine-specific)